MSNPTATATPGRPTVARATGRVSGRFLASPLLRGAAGVVLVAFAWEASSRGGLVDARYLPPATTVLATATGLLTDTVFLRDTVSLTLVSWLGGLAIAATTAIPLGALLGAAPALERATRPIVDALRPIPAVALLPLVVLILGIDLESRLFLIAYAAAWPILLNTTAGIRATEPALLEVARVHGHRPLAVLLRVRLPAAAPFTAAGLRISASIALIAAVSLELVTGTDEGLGGHLVHVASGGESIDTVLAVTVIAGLLGLSINLAAEHAEHALFGWHHSRRVAP